MDQPDPSIVAWVSANVIPFEEDLRLRLRRRCASASDVDDLVQDVYYRILKMESVAHVRDARAFLMQTAKNILIDRVRHEAIVSIDAVADIDKLDVADPAPDPERVALARAELNWVLGLVARLPDRCRAVFSARRISGLSADETAASLGLSENIVEKDNVKGFRLVTRMAAQPPARAVVRPLRKRNV